DDSYDALTDKYADYADDYGADEPKDGASGR
ncbi:MAG: hypothetical protein JWN52_8065, partial [Actinomycetia bacterium]|nr:hypothetical protein [Actinomycetes bacterium]